jgi:hypothetical protein
METRSTTKKKRIKVEYIEEQSTIDDIDCPIDVEEIIKHKRIKLEYVDE